MLLPLKSGALFFRHLFHYVCSSRSEEETVRTAFERAGVAGGTIDFESLKSLSDEGIDMSFVDSLQKQFSHQQVSIYTF